jgi:hypothetical protein
MNHTIYAFDINSTGCNIGSNQGHALSVLETFHGTVSLTL